MWPESEGRRGPNEVASCLFDYMKERSLHCVKEIHMFSNNCGGQDRNRYVAFALWFARNHLSLSKITHTFLEKGHTETENGSIHATIERATKCLKLYTPYQWYTAVRAARVSKQPYKIKEMTAKDFVDFKSMSNNVKSLAIGDDGQKIMWSRTRKPSAMKEDPHTIFLATAYGGCHECEVFTCGHEAEESEHNWKICTKNRGHHKFIPAPEFHLGHLPEWARHSSVLEYVQLVASLTVRVKVTFTSCERPEGYTFHNYRGSPCTREASGFIQDVYPGRGPCPCRECKDSPTPPQEWFWVNIETACHVVYDTSEAQFTEVNVFYDDENSQTSGRMKTILALDTIIKDHDKDFCALRCATHDKQLSRKILQNKLKLDVIVNLHEAKLHDNANILCVIVSHPHGCAKTITVGEIERFIRDDALMQVRYTTDTCPGSSGAPVLVINFRKGDSRPFSSKGRGLHSETVCVEGKTLNMSAEFLTSFSTNSLNFMAERMQSVRF
ncbi:hypothetical protein PoB_000252400 [Plakobranchus ocellatus]|uniref:Uncharacterized protein n=1 Tax=Plakobranchus ocellatus TaxID=259542 RepID=A0AAV3XYU9_9GAST|nr:hypothetical protein PoB_000252400 [Plakobranchus ocellatus]